MNIKKIIKENGWTLEQVAAEMTNKQGEKGISHSAVSQIINGNPTLDKLKEIASIIGVSVSDLVSDNNPKTSIKCPKCGTSITLKVEQR